MHNSLGKPCAVLVAALSFTGPLAAQTGARATSLTLADAIALARERSHQARAAEAARDAAEHRAGAFTASLLPQLSIGGNVPSYNRSIIEVLQPDGSTLFRPQNLTTAALTATVAQTIPFTGGDLFVSSSLSRLSVSGAQEDLSWQSTPVLIGLRQPLFRPNTVGWNRREQRYDLELAEQQYLESREDLSLETSTLFFTTYAAEVTLANALANAAVNDTLYRLNTGRYDIGSIGENDLLQSELALLRARTAVDGARLDLERSMAALKLALNLPADASVTIVIPDSAPTVELDTARAVAEALRNSSAVSRVALDEVQADRRVAEARLNNGFGAVLQASYGFNATGPAMQSAYQDLLEAQRVTLSVDIPLWQWGVRRESVRAAESDREGVRASAERTIEQTALDARFAALDLAQARRGLVLSATADTVAQKRFEIAYNRYVIGRISVDNLYIAQNEKDEARQAYVRALIRYWEAYYRLRRVTLYDFEQGQAIR
jgi:outer membrane protein TolC